ncbi:MAG TPA: FAD-dependent monooxygenase [Chitinophagales bacterium]
MEPETFEADICIIGAGVAGAALACSLANSNRKICVVEKDSREPDRIVGELLQPDGIEQLSEMGLKHLLDGYDAQNIIGYTIVKDNNPLHINYPAGKTGRGLRNGKFVQKMRCEFSTAENIKCFEAEAKTFLHNNDNGIEGIVCADKTGNHFVIHAKITIITDGIFSGFRKQLVSAKEEITGFFLGFLLKDCPLPFAQRGHVFLTETSPFLCYPVSQNEIRFLVDFPKGQPPKKSDELIQYLNQHVRSRLPQTMYDAFDLCMQEAKFKVMPNHYLPAQPIQTDGMIILGDALNMRHPLTGGGMTVSLRDVNSLSSLLKTMRIDTAKQRLKVWNAFYESRQQNTVVNVLADALYNVMSNQELKNACFDYLAEGGKKAEEPIALLSGLNRRKATLSKHFFAVAAKGGWDKMKQQPSVSSLSNAYSMMSDAYHIIFPLLKNEARSKLTKGTLQFAKTLFKQKTQ